MARPGEFFNRFRYAALAVLTVVTAAYGYYLYTLYRPVEPPSPPPSIVVAVMADGSIKIDGEPYSDPEKLKIKVAEIQKNQPGVGFNIRARYGAPFEPTIKAAALLQKSGAKAVWIINEPKNEPEK